MQPAACRCFVLPYVWVWVYQVYVSRSHPTNSHGLSVENEGVQSPPGKDWNPVGR